MNKRGIVLLPVLIILIIITSLMLSILSDISMQIRMQDNFLQKKLSFLNAENILIFAQHSITIDKTAGSYQQSNSSYSYQRITPNYCLEKYCYLITAQGRSGAALTILHNIYVLEWLTTDKRQLKKYSWWWTDNEF